MALKHCLRTRRSTNAYNVADGIEALFTQATADPVDADEVLFVHPGGDESEGHVETRAEGAVPTVHQDRRGVHAGVVLPLLHLPAHLQRVSTDTHLHWVSTGTNLHWVCRYTLSAG